MIGPRSHVLLWLALVMMPIGLAGADLSQRSVSSSRQFNIYCNDVPLRVRTSTFAEETKAQLLALLGRADGRGYPIVIEISGQAAADPGRPASRVQMVEVEGGFKIAVEVTIGNNNIHEVQLQKQLVRALLLELAYRSHAQLLHGARRYVEPPWWLVEGTLHYLRTRDGGPDSGLFQTLLETNRLPAPRAFLERNPEQMDSTSRSLFRAYAGCLLQLLIELPNGRAALAQYITDLPTVSGDPLTALIQHFPSLGGSEQSLEKLWTVTIARFSAADRYKAFSPAETEQQLKPLLTVEIPADAKNPARTFALADFKEFVRLPAGRAALLANRGRLIALAARANPLSRPVVSEYEAIVDRLARGKTRGIPERLATVADDRELVLKRTEEIADYLNWFEATKLTSRSSFFDDYLRTANGLSQQPATRDDSISKYLDTIALQLQ